MQIILESYDIPEQGTFQIEQTITIQVSADEARRQVDQWLLHEVNSQMGASRPVLVVGEKNVWRVPVYWGVPLIGRVGIVGTVEVNVLSGEIGNILQCKSELIHHAQALAEALPPYQARTVPEAFLSRDVTPTHQPGRPSGNPLDLLSRSS